MRTENTLVISNKNVVHIIRIIKPPENLGTLIDEASEAVKHEIKNPDGEFLGVLLESSDAYMLGNMLTRKVVMRAGKGFMRARKYIYIYIYIYNYMNNMIHMKAKFYGVFSKDNLPK